MKMVKVKQPKVNVHTSLGKDVAEKIARLARAYDLDKCDVINSLLVIGMHAHALHVKTTVKKCK